MSDKPEHTNEETGRLAGFGAGAVVGGQLGTVLIPIPFVGTFTGVLLGGALGGKVGQRFGPTILNAVDSLGQGLSTMVQPSQPSQRSSSIPITTPGVEAAPEGDLLSQLERLGNLRSQGLLTEQEFAAAKAQLLNR